MAGIKNLKFNKNTPEELRKTDSGDNWPVVYVINNDTEAYVGETVNAARRTEQHLKNEARQTLENIHIISNDDFNKSVVLDLESFLIKYMSSDGRFVLQNGNGGIQEHDYYQRKLYEDKFKDIWTELKELGLTEHSLAAIENSDLYKYSPYKSLTDDQLDIVRDILKVLEDNKRDPEGSTIVVKGGAGTGKTVLGVYLMKLFSDANEKQASIPVYSDLDPEDEEDMEEFGFLKYAVENFTEMKVGLVIPQVSLRTTLINVFGNIRNMSGKMVLSANDIPKDYYDLLIVDEAHRLRQRKALAQYPLFDKNNKKLGLDKDTATELDWVLKCSRNQVLFYDPQQTVKPSDIDPEDFKRIIDRSRHYEFGLKSQLRCMGGNDYIDYVKAVLSDDPPTAKPSFDGYDLRFYDHIKEMIDDIKKIDEEIGLCRAAAGYAWKWKTKKNHDPGMYDIEIENEKYIWNTTADDWINSPNSINEIGCIHTVQGYDLNYAGIIFGNEIDYDPADGKITIDKSNYFDQTGKTALKNEEELKEYILNIYATLMTMGIKGTFVYVCNDELRKYLMKYF
ncbi:MAG: DNA/RNA helicase domain-containing protein [Eubacteriaceae bacterium]|nr:DNA/RNA helicase domain-containing protein [Eubacteriaceae bacterium]